MAFENDIGPDYKYDIYSDTEEGYYDSNDDIDDNREKPQSSPRCAIYCYCKMCYVKSRCDANAAECEDGFLEVGFLGFDRDKVEVFHRRLVEDDEICGAIRIGRGECGDGENQENGECAEHKVQWIQSWMPAARISRRVRK